MSLTNPYAKIFSCIDSIISMTDEEKHRVANAFTLKCIPNKKCTMPIYLTHPAFGNLNTTQWGIAAWKHMHHHLRQFGV